MKKLLTLVLALGFTLPSMAVVVGKVDVQKVLLTINEGKKVRDKLKKEFDKKQVVIKKEEESIKKLQENFKKQSLLMKEDAKQKKIQEIQKKILALQQKTQKFQQEIQAMENKMKEPILKKLKDIIVTASKDAKVDLTFETNTAPVIYAKSEKDLTDAVVKAYNKKHK